MLTLHFLSPPPPFKLKKIPKTNKESVEHKKDTQTKMQKEKRKPNPIQCGKIIFNIKGKHVCF